MPRFSPPSGVRPSRRRRAAAREHAAAFDHGLASAPTASSSTCTCRATAWSSSITTPLSSAPPAGGGRCGADRRGAGGRRCRLQVSRARRKLSVPGQGIGHAALREVLSRYPGIPLIIELKSPGGGRSRAARSTRSAPRAGRRAGGASDPFTGRALAAVRRLRAAHHDRRRPGRDALGAVPVVGAAGRSAGPAYREFQVPERSGRTTIVTPQFIDACPSRRPAGEGLDGRRARGHRAAARLGGRRHHQRPAGRRGRGAGMRTCVAPDAELKFRAANVRNQLPTSQRGTLAAPQRPNDPTGDSRSGEDLTPPLQTRHAVH